VQGLLSDEYACSIATTIAMDRGEPDARPDDPWRSSTSHLSVVDAKRTMVACPSTLGELFGSAVAGRLAEARAAGETYLRRARNKGQPWALARAFRACGLLAR
jgi:Gamma-glutamyltranspeptidase